MSKSAVANVKGAAPVVCGGSNVPDISRVRRENSVRPDSERIVKERSVKRHRAVRMWANR